MAERLRRVQPVAVANHVKARQSPIERAVTWLATESSWAQVNVLPFTVVSFAQASLFSISAAPVVRTSYMIETFRIVTGSAKVEIEDFFECNNNNYNLHGHRFKMTDQRNRTNARSSFFSQCVENIWNGLPRTLLSASSVNNFKNLLDDCAESDI